TDHFRKFRYWHRADRPVEFKIQSEREAEMRECLEGGLSISLTPVFYTQRTDCVAIMPAVSENGTGEFESYLTEISLKWHRY
ncbi:TPA: hypothetical protein MH027_11610, partial [Klebsiella variicola]|nr:hypothetical protein [Klebsiella variicola]